MATFALQLRSKPPSAMRPAVRGFAAFLRGRTKLGGFQDHLSLHGGFDRSLALSSSLLALSCGLASLWQASKLY
ncbi:hypothetical protein GOP47_0029122 [Adiantum capillus-veneris]|nr:hypothetical protein GOP47_0029122 [Adiantum capillus-veneris]